jgi:hypothetical protein
MDFAHHIENNKNARNAPWIVRIADKDLRCARKESRLPFWEIHHGRQAPSRTLPNPHIETTASSDFDQRSLKLPSQKKVLSASAQSHPDWSVAEWRDSAA